MDMFKESNRHILAQGWTQARVAHYTRQYISLKQSQDRDRDSDKQGTQTKLSDRHILVPLLF
jgi:hypothetical protein